MKVEGQSGVYDREEDKGTKNRMEEVEGKGREEGNRGRLKQRRGKEEEREERKNLTQ